VRALASLIHDGYGESQGIDDKRFWVIESEFANVTHQPAALCEISAIQDSDKGWLENSTCLGVKNIRKPCALIAHTRFDEGGQARFCPLPFPCRFRPDNEYE